MESISFFHILIIGLAVWKLHDLCFHFGELKTERALNVMLLQFYAQHTYKLMNKHSEYREAPQEIYDWLTDSFGEWQEEVNINNKNNKEI